MPGAHRPRRERSRVVVASARTVQTTMGVTRTMRRLTVVLLLLVVVGATALVVTEAGGGASNTAQTGAQTGRGLHGGGRGVPSPPAAADSAIDVRSTPLGTILVDAKGRTLYLFEADRAHMSN